MTCISIINNLNTLQSIKPGKITTVLFDMDGVIVDWAGYVGRRLYAVDEMFHLINHKYNIELLNSLDSDLRSTIVNKYYTLFPDTFKHLDVDSGFLLLKGAIEMLLSAGFKVGILSAGTLDHPNYEIVEHDKRFNLQHHLGDLTQHLEITIVNSSSDKVNYAKDDTVLIDDYHKNIKAFNDAGGIGLRHHDSKNTVIKLLELLGAK